jgi:hypothetical protein
MMTSTTATAIPLGQGRTIREVVAHQHALVNEVFCRKIFRQLLASLESQYAMRMPHRAITPDTVVLQENGEPMLLPSPLQAGEQSEAADLQALASVVHYAITTEWPPGAKLRQRQLAGYSDSLLGAIDKCLAPDPLERPRTINQLRNLLGIVSLGPATPGAAPVLADVPRSEPAPGRAGWRHGGLTRLQRWALIGAAASVLLAALAGLVALLRAGAPADNVVLTLPPAAERSARGLDSNESVVAPPPAHLPGGVAAVPGSGAPLPATPTSQGPPVRAPQVAAGSVSPGATARPAAPASGKTEYKVMIKPWGTLYVDGQDRGVSPPVKRLVLAAGRHTVRIVNPAYPDRVLRIDAGRTASGKIAHDFSTASR